ncbi:MAG: DUF2079 domain-containing protein [Candidatus Omnitrophica bacterium]|nr:DUF2079 domain-containing protein [Candidatus Omnitrophota bacterium]
MTSNGFFENIMHIENERPASKYSLAFLVVVYIAFFSAYCFMSFRAFGYYDWDLAVYDQIIWNITRGDLFSSLLGVNFLGHHVHFLAFPIAFIYKLFPHPYTLLFLQTAALGGAAVPLYYLARQFLDLRWSFLVCCFYLLHQGVWQANIYEFHFTAFAPLIFFSMFSFYFSNNYFRFVFTAVAALLCQENFALFTFFFGVLALVQHRSVRWWLPVLTGSLLYILLCFKFLIPFLNPGIIQFVSIYRQWGADYRQIAGNLLAHPLQALQFMFLPAKLSWLGSIFMPLSFVPLLSPGFLLLALPVFLQRLLSSRPQETALMYHYQAELLPFIFLALIFGLRRLMRVPFLSTTRAFWGYLMLAVVLFHSYSAVVNICSKNIDRTVVTGADNVKAQWVKDVPSKASVVASFEFLSHLSNRKDLYSFQYIYNGRYILSNTKYALNKLVDMALIDFDDPFLVRAFYYPLGYKNIREFLDRQKFAVADVANNMVFFRRGGKDQMALYDVSGSAPKIAHALDIRIDDVLRLAGYDTAWRTGRLEVTLYWQVLKKPTFDLAAVFVLRSAKTGQSTIINSPAGYRIFPTQAWDSGTWITEYKYLLAPEQVLRDELGLAFVKAGVSATLPLLRLAVPKGEH